MKIVRIIVSVLLILALAATLILGIVAVVETDKVPEPTKPTKAFILLPGLMGSNLMDENDFGVWALSEEGMAEMFADVKKTVGDLQKVVNIQENGIPTYYFRPADMSDGEGYMHSINGMLKYCYTYLKETYGTKGWDVVNWQYDWRYSNIYTAGLLENFINEKGYENVVFLSHSMGGSVIAKYLAKQENRDKVSLFIPFGAPFFGSYDVYDFLFGDPMNSTNLFSIALQLIDGKSATQNLPAIFELGPYPQLDSTPHFSNGERSIKYDGEFITISQEIDLIKTLPLSKMSNGDYKPALAGLDDYQKMDFVMKDGKLVHITDTIPTEYVVGYGEETRIGVDLLADATIDEYRTSDEGDGTVPVYSGTAGHPLDAENVTVMQDYTHGALMETPYSVEVLAEILKKHNV